MESLLATLEGNKEEGNSNASNEEHSLCVGTGSFFLQCQMWQLCQSICAHIQVTMMQTLWDLRAAMMTTTKTSPSKTTVPSCGNDRAVAEEEEEEEEEEDHNHDHNHEEGKE